MSEKIFVNCPNCNAINGMAEYGINVMRCLICGNIYTLNIDCKHCKWSFGQYADFCAKSKDCKKGSLFYPKKKYKDIGGGA